MTPDAVAADQAKKLRESVLTRNLVLTQMGSAFDVVREPLLAELGGLVVSATRLGDVAATETSRLIVVDELEKLTSGLSGPESLGALREWVMELLSRNLQIVLISRAPRIAFRDIPGSSVLEDASLVLLDPMPRDSALVRPDKPMSHTPQGAFSENIDGLTQRVVDELGIALISALDHALFEIDPRSSDGLQFLEAREVEGLRGACLLTVDADGEIALGHPRLLSELRQATAAVIARQTAAPADLAAVTAGLWYVERTLRQALREWAVAKSGDQWRSDVLGGLADEILRRAQSDTAIAVVSVKELRDPLEWLTLSELVDLATAERVGGLDWSSHIWRRFREQLVPVRNRVAHVRLLKYRDREIVHTWRVMVKQKYDR